jgi:predicted pyridoxine 5'-phosphate oxidase superfamily flavin-nucleotide-binding protein
MSEHAPFHAGERAVQARLGETDEAARNGRALSTSIVRGALPFIAQQPFAVLATVDADGAPWASLVFGEAGFLSAPDPEHVQLDTTRARIPGGSPWTEHLERDPRLGMLFIEPGSRRRLRVNGRARQTPNAWQVDVREAYPNCPKYIRRRELTTELGSPSASVEWRSGAQLEPAHLELIRAADTTFVASAAPGGELDASHRGGEPGFVQVLEDPGGTVLEIPDYPGNHMYNTLGNFELEPRAGMVFLDFTSGQVLQLSGRVSVDWKNPEASERTGGTERLWRFAVEHWVEHRLPVNWRWESFDASPYNPPAF